MTDVFTKKKRSQVMSRIRSKDTKPECFIRSGLHQLGFRYRLHAPDIPGKPDLVFPKYNALLFVHGCFWHKHECHLFKWPKTRQQFWKKKIQGNWEKDEKVKRILAERGWRVLLVWECSIKGKKRYNSETLMKNISQWLKSRSEFLEIGGED